MSEAVSWRVHARRAMLAAVGLASVGAAVGVQFAPAEVLDIRAATTPQLAGVLGLLVLPMVTVGAMLLDHQFLRRRRRELMRSEPVPATPSLESARAVDAPSPAAAAVPVPISVPEKAPSIGHPGGPRVAPALLPVPVLSRSVPGPKIEVIVESKARPQVLTLVAPVRGAVVRTKSAA